jgi:MFS family permease
VPQRDGWRLLAALTALNVLSFVDRQLVAALAPLLIADLGLTREQVGLLIGPAFIVVFSASMLMMAVLADRTSRTRLASAGLALWSAATALTGASSGMRTLAACRALVGVGEGTLSPAALAMIADVFPPARLGLAGGIFYTGIPVGFAGSYALAGWIAPRLGWRACFWVLGIAGLAAAALTWRMSDPPRQGRSPAGRPVLPASGNGPDTPLRVLGRALANEPSLPLLIAGATALAYAAAASQHGITWLVQERGFAFARAAWLSAAVVGSAGFAGCVGLGWITDRARRHGARRRLQAFAGVGALALVLSALFYSSPAGTPLFYAGWIGAQGFLLGWYGPLVAAILERSPAPARATVIGATLLVVNLLGVATGAWITGRIGDRTSLTRGLLIGVAVGAVGLLLVLAASRQREPAA